MILMAMAAFIFTTKASFANDNTDYGRSFLRIDINFYGNVHVEIDGIRYDCYNGIIDVRALAPGRHQVTVLQEFINRRGYAKVDILCQQNIFVPANSRLKAVVRANGNFDLVSVGRKARNNVHRQPVVYNNYRPAYRPRCR